MSWALQLVLTTDLISSMFVISIASLRLSVLVIRNSITHSVRLRSPVTVYCRPWATVSNKEANLRVLASQGDGVGVCHKDESASVSCLWSLTYER